MAFQTKVNSAPAIGIAGQAVSIADERLLPFAFVSDGTVKAGAFAFGKAWASDAKGEQFALASATAIAGTIALGFVPRRVTSTILNVLEDGTEVYPQGFNVDVAIEGSYYAVATGAVNNGDSVNVEPTTGEITYGTIATNGTEKSTGWKVLIPNNGASAVAGDVIIYTK